MSEILIYMQELRPPAWKPYYLKTEMNTSTYVELPKQLDCPHGGLVVDFEFSYELRLRDKLRI